MIKPSDHREPKCARLLDCRLLQLWHRGGGEASVRSVERFLLFLFEASETVKILDFVRFFLVKRCVL
jgi:hypothetical protein